MWWICCLEGTGWYCYCISRIHILRGNCSPLWSDFPVWSISKGFNWSVDRSWKGWPDQIWPIKHQNYFFCCQQILQFQAALHCSLVKILFFHFTSSSSPLAVTSPHLRVNLITSPFPQNLTFVFSFYFEQRINLTALPPPPLSCSSPPRPAPSIILFLLSCLIAMTF